MKICINKSHLDTHAVENNKIEDLEKLYQIIDLDDCYNDCRHSDFDLIDGSYVFNTDKYNARKQKLEFAKEIYDIKAMLASTDYQAIKFAEGQITEEEFSPIKTQRASWRAKINELEEKIR